MGAETTRRPRRWPWVVGTAVVVLFVAAGVVAVMITNRLSAMFGPTGEDRERAAELEQDPMLDAKIDGLDPVGPVKTRVGGGQGGFAMSTEVVRTFETSHPLDEMLDDLVAEAERHGWTIDKAHSQTPGRYYGRGTRDLGTYTAVLTLHLRPGDTGLDVVEVVISTNNAASDP
jgi:hypothetical protein